MAQYETGPRLGKTGLLRIGTSAVILEPGGSKILLTRRTDNGRWCLPGGAMDPGESVAECCVREVWEETGLRVRTVRLTGIYSNPDLIVKYSDGNRWQIVAVNFLMEVVSGRPELSDETTEVGYFSLEEIATMDLIEPHSERINDALSGQEAAFFS